jgi:hypothetical protein
MKKNQPLNWTDDMKTEFNKMHLLMAANTLSAFLITTNTSTSTQTLPTTKWVFASYKMANPLPIIAKSIIVPRKITQPLKRKCCQ